MTGETYAGFVKSPDASAYDELESVGAWTAPFLVEHPEAECELAALFRARVEEAAQPPWLWMEGVRGPKSLRQADEALGFLKDGHHVLLAGAPGTGKTTVAQWVAHAWNAGADRVPAEAVAALLAPTTVANSAWSPFHTIGGRVRGSLPEAVNSDRRPMP